MDSVRSADTMQRNGGSSAPSLSPEALMRAAIAAHGRPLEPRETFVYFIQGVDGGPIKIGFSARPLERLKAVQTGNPVRLRFTNIVVAEQIEELRLHMLFHAQRLSGEWFAAHPSLAAIANAIPDNSLADVPIVYSTASVHHDSPAEFQEPNTRALREHEASFVRRAYDASRNLADTDDASPWRETSVTFRPEPDEGGWRNSSADC